MAKGRFIDPDAWKPSRGIVLDDYSRKVITAKKNISVIAGPGSGKTELLAQRATYLLQTGICQPPRRILAISYKRDAAKNLRDRVIERCATEMSQRFDSYTYDAFAKSLIDRFRAMSPNWCRPPRGYGISFVSRDDWDEFLRLVRPPNQLGGRNSAMAVTLEDVQSQPPPMDSGDVKDMVSWLTVEWWRRSLEKKEPTLTFQMISSLAYSILSDNPQLLQALRITYSHVFLDEFQDTTAGQYRLTQLIFKDTSVALTAVGDTNQRIMTWAGAVPEVFQWFGNDFGETTVKLQFNYRSNSKIVRIINNLIQEIEPDAIKTISARRDRKLPKNASAFYIFDTDRDEAAWTADFIANEIGIRPDGNFGPSPEDFAVLVRNRADAAEATLDPFFTEHGLRIRNEARRLDGIDIQNLMSDELYLLIIGIIRLAIGKLAKEVYRNVETSLGAIFITDFNRSKDIHRLDGQIRKIVGIVRRAIQKSPSSTDMSQLIDRVIDVIGEQALWRAFRRHENREYFVQVQRSLAQLLEECSEDAADWLDLINAVEGKGQVRLMTIHKSKGLEYHTVIVRGLHQRAFFGFRNRPVEETNTFFVALSRARERIFFTRSEESGEMDELNALVEILRRADVPIIMK